MSIRKMSDNELSVSLQLAELKKHITELYEIMQSLEHKYMKTSEQSKPKRGANMEYRMVTKVTDSDGDITQELFIVTETYTQRISEWVMNTKDAQIRKALIDLGWTPPA